jgi:hypothetical protein
MPMKKSVRSKASADTKRPSRAKAAKAKAGKFGAGVILMAVMSVAVVAVLIAARESSDTPTNLTADAQPQMGADQTGTKKMAASRAAADVPMATPTTGMIAADAADADASAGSPATKKPAPVTIAGCLERDENTFRLKDTAGADAPKSRSWRSGFLKKGSAPIDLVESGNGLKLRDHVGKRVSVTGTLADRRMRVQSVRRVASTCS